MPAPFLSVITDDCIRKGKDYNAGGARYNHTFIQFVGIGSLTDSLAAHRSSWSSTSRRLTLDGAGRRAGRRLRRPGAAAAAAGPPHAQVRQRRRRTPTQLMVRAFKRDLRRGRRPAEHARAADTRSKCCPRPATSTSASVTGATPDGRRAGLPLSEGISPVQGADRHGPTAVVKSAAKMDHIKTGGTLLNMKFTPVAAGRRARDRQAGASGAQLLQAGRPSRAVQRGARRDAAPGPERTRAAYRDLIVRVAGYSDYFCDLSPRTAGRDHRPHRTRWVLKRFITTLSRRGESRCKRCKPSRVVPVASGIGAAFWPRDVRPVPGPPACCPPRDERAAEPKKLRIRIVYSLHAVEQPGPDWPNVGFDFQPVMDRIAGQLRQHCPEYEFVVSLANGPEAAAKILEQDRAGGVDGYLVYQLNCWNRVVQAIADSGKPTLYADFQYGGSGGFLVYTSAFLRKAAPNLGFVASSKTDDLLAAVRCFDVLRQGGGPAEFALATAQVRTRTDPGHRRSGLSPRRPADADAARLSGTDEGVQDPGGRRRLAGIAPAIQSEMGIAVVQVPFEEVNAAWLAADNDESQAIAQRWQRSAAEVRDVSAETLQQSAAMYLAQKAVLDKHGANAITINCLGGFYGGHIHAYPCLGFHELLNEGLIGACECDLRSTATMVAMTALSQGRPGLYLRPGDGQLGAADHLCPLRGLEQGLRTRRHGESVRDPHAFRRPAGRLGPFHPAGGIHDHHRGIRAGTEGNPVPPGQGGRQRRGRPRLPYQAGRRAGRRLREAVHRVGPLGLAPCDLLRRSRTARAGPGRGPGRLASHPGNLNNGGSPVSRRKRCHCMDSRPKVLVSGCYDLLHAGHVVFFETAAQYGDLYVCLVPTRTSAQLKGRNTMFTEQERLYMVQSIRYVRKARISRGSGLLDFEPEMAELRPDFFLVNEDGGSPQKRQLCQKYGVQYVELERVPKPGLPARSSTDVKASLS